MKKTANPWAMVDLFGTTSFFKQQNNEKGKSFEAILAGDANPNETESADEQTPEDTGGDTENPDGAETPEDSGESTEDPGEGGDIATEEPTPDEFGGGFGEPGDDTSSSDTTETSAPIDSSEAPKTGENPLSETYTQIDLIQHIRSLLENIRETIDIAETISAKNQPVVVKGLRELELTVQRLDECTYVLPVEDCLPRYALAVQEYQKWTQDLKRLATLSGG